MSMALIYLGVIAICVPFVIELCASRGVSLWAAFGKTVIISSIAHIGLLIVLGMVGWLSFVGSITTSVLIAIVWCFVRRGDLGDVFHTLKYIRWVHVVNVIPFLLALGVAIVLLSYVHFQYTGQVAQLNTINFVYNQTSTYPYYSDEWVIADAVREISETGRLPLDHPFDPARSFVNILLPFTLLVAHFFLTLNLDPVASFAYAPMVCGVLLAACVYLLARRMSASMYASALAAITLLFVTNGSNLAGLWYLIPLHAGLVVFTATLLIRELKPWLRILGFVLTVALYPPFIVFVVPVALLDLHKRENVFKMIGYAAGYAVLLCLALVLFTRLTFSGLFVWLSHTLSRSIGVEFTGEVVSYLPHHVIPIVVLIGFVFGIRAAWKDHKDIVCTLCIGIVLWLLHQIFAVGFVIDIQRVVFATAFGICAVAALGYDFVIFSIAREMQIPEGRRLLGSLMLVVTLAVVVISARAYTSDDSWKQLTLAGEVDGFSVQPAPPASKYLIEDDVSLFSLIPPASSVTFLSHPWKGLVIGAATGHTPLHTKWSIVGTNKADYETFVSASCEEKTKIANSKKISHVYTPAFSCAEFSSLGTSSESIVLYEVQK